MDLPAAGGEPDWRTIVEKEGRNARNLLNWSVPVQDIGFTAQNQPFREKKSAFYSPTPASPSKAVLGKDDFFSRNRVKNDRVVMMVERIHRTISNIYSLSDGVDSTDEDQIIEILAKCHNNLESLRKRCQEESLLPSGIRFEAPAPAPIASLLESPKKQLLSYAMATSGGKPVDQEGEAAEGTPKKAQPAAPSKASPSTPARPMANGQASKDHPSPTENSGLLPSSQKAWAKEVDAEELKRAQLAKLSKAEEVREQYLLEKSGKIRSKGTARSREVNERVAEKKQLLQQQISDKLEKADQNRENRIKEVVRKAKEEDLKVEEVAFIKHLSTEEKLQTISEKHKGSEALLSELEEQRKKKAEEQAARERAALEKRRQLEAEKLAKYEKSLEQKKRDQEKLKELERQRALEQKEARRQKMLELQTQRAELDDAALFSQSAEDKEKSKVYTKKILGLLEHEDKVSWDKKRAGQSRKTHTGVRFKSLFQTMGVLNSRLVTSDANPINIKQDFDKINELIESILDSWKDKGERFAMAEIDEIFTLRDCRTLVTLNENMLISRIRPAKTIRLVFTLINLICKLPHLRECFVYHAFGGSSGWVAFANIFNDQVSFFISSDLERAEAAATVLTTMVTMLSNESWQEIRTDGSPCSPLKAAMIGYLFSLNFVEKVEHHLRHLHGEVHDGLVFSCLVLFTEIVQTLGPDLKLAAENQQSLESKALFEQLGEGMRKTNFMGLLTYLQGVLLRTGPVQTKGFNSPRPSRGFIKVGTQVLRLFISFAQADLTTLQEVLGRGQTGIEFAHLTSSALISLNSVYWRREPEVEETQTFLTHLLRLLTYFAMGNTLNQSSLRTVPTASTSALFLLPQMPFHFYLNADLKEHLLIALISLCYQNVPNVEVIAREISSEWFVDFLASKKVPEKAADKLEDRAEREKQEREWEERKREHDRVAALLPSGDFSALSAFFQKHIRIFKPIMEDFLEEKERQKEKEKEKEKERKKARAVLIDEPTDLD